MRRTRGAKGLARRAKRHPLPSPLSPLQRGTAASGAEGVAIRSLSPQPPSQRGHASQNTQPERPSMAPSRLTRAH